MRVAELGMLAECSTFGPLPVGFRRRCPGCWSILEVTEEDRVLMPFEYHDRGYLYYIWEPVCPHCKRKLWIQEDDVRSFLMRKLDKEEEQRKLAEKAARPKRWLIF